MKILFLGGDKRYEKIINHLIKNHDVYAYGYSNENINVNKINDEIKLYEYDIIFFPMNGISDDYIINTLDGKKKVNNFYNIRRDSIIFTGIISKRMLELGNSNIVSFLSYEDVKKHNSKITVDGIIDDIKNRNKDKICILGYGNIGKRLYDKLTYEGYECKVGDNDLDKIDKEFIFNTDNLIEFKSNILDSSIIINTVPHNIISEEIINSLNPRTYILDVASYPYGIKDDLVKKYGLYYKILSGIPGKYNPEESGEILLKKVNGIIGGKK